MHPYLKQIVPCIEKCKKIEAVFIRRKIALPDAQISNQPGSLMFSHKIARGDRSVYWGISSSLLPHAFPREDLLHAYFYIQFHRRRGSVVKLAFSPIRGRWGSDLTLKELETIEEALKTEEIDPDRLAREIRAGNLDEDQFTQELETQKVLDIVSIMAKWLVDMDEPRFSQTKV